MKLLKKTLTDSKYSKKICSISKKIKVIHILSQSMNLAILQIMNLFLY